MPDASRFHDAATKATGERVAGKENVNFISGRPPVSTAVGVVEYSCHKPEHISMGLMEKAANEDTQRAVDFSAISSLLAMELL